MYSTETSRQVSHLLLPKILWPQQHLMGIRAADSSHMLVDLHNDHRQGLWRGPIRINGDSMVALIFFQEIHSLLQHTNC